MKRFAKGTKGYKRMIDRKIKKEIFRKKANDAIAKRKRLEVIKNTVEKK